MSPERISQYVSPSPNPSARAHPISITAIALAYEINCRLMDAFDMSSRGWDDATVFSPPAVALAAGKLMKLGPDKLAQAVSLAINDHIPMGQTRAQGLSDWKGLADAEAGRNAVFATMLARAGITGPAPIFEGRKGFFQLVSGPADINVEAFGGRGNQFKTSRMRYESLPGRLGPSRRPQLWRALNWLRRTVSSTASRPLRLPPRRGATNRPGRPEKWTPSTEIRPITACPILRPVQCSMAI